jgi:hypothetical protein
MSRRNGVGETGMSLSFASRSGMLMMVTHMSRLVMRCPSDSDHPAVRNQMMFPMSEQAPASGRRSRVAAEWPQAEQFDSRGRDAERDRDDQDSHDERHDGVAECQRAATEAQPDEVERQLHHGDSSSVARREPEATRLSRERKRTARAHCGRSATIGR